MAANRHEDAADGLRKKPIYVVPNHMLEQFRPGVHAALPNARLLVAGKEDLTRDRRKFLTAKIASAIGTASSRPTARFERIGMSQKYQEEFLVEQITEYNQLLIDSASKDAKRAQRNINQDAGEAEGRPRDAAERPAGEGKKTTAWSLTS